MDWLSSAILIFLAVFSLFGHYLDPACPGKPIVCPDGTVVSERFFNNCEYDSCMRTPGDYSFDAHTSSKGCEGYALFDIEGKPISGNYSAAAMAGNILFQGPSGVLFEIRQNNKFLQTAKVSQSEPYVGRLPNGEILRIDLCKVAFNNTTNSLVAYANITIKSE